MKKKIFTVLKYVAFTALGIFLFWLVYRGQDFERIWEIVRSELNYFWIVVSLFCGLLSHISRTLRWKIALEPLGEKPKTVNTFITVMVAYFMNLLLPRMGEVVRCGMLSKYEKIGFSKLFGTVISERIIDVVMLFLTLALAFVIEFDKIIHFGKQNPAVMENISRILQSPYLWAGFLLVFLALFLYIRKSKKKEIKSKIEHIVLDFASGIKSILAMKRYKAYIAHTFFIWLMYYLMLYLVFLSFEPTQNLHPGSALITFVLASFGMVAPVQGGIGAWHFMAQKGLELYGVSAANGKIFALIAHSSMNIMVIILGVLSIILVPIVNSNYHPKRELDNHLTE